MDDSRLKAAREIILHLSEQLDLPCGLRLWDGEVLPLGSIAEPPYVLRVAGPGTLGRLLRRPNLETLLKAYAAGEIELESDDMLGFVAELKRRKIKFKAARLQKGYLLKRALPLLFSRGQSGDLAHAYGGEETGLNQEARRETDFIQFHYDVSNDFYALFLDPEMLYSCAYFTSWENSLEQAQKDKLDMICRKLRLKEGERFLDVGSGWGALLCHAARNYGVRARGVTLSQRQYEFSIAKIRRLGLQDQVEVELKNYEDLDGEFDKISSIGMYEHVGIANYPRYFGKLFALLRDRGLLLNHGITRGAKKSARKFNKIRPEKRLILKYIFPGSELDHIGHSLEVMEAQGFEIHDVECWREHYARTCKLWHRRLVANKERAIELVGPERYRLWIAYLAGVAFPFEDGSLRIYQTLASKHRAKGPSGLPPTRADLYA